MPRIRFTDRSIQAVQPPPSGQAEYFDANGRLPGFGLRVSASGRKSWVVLYRSGGRPRRLTLGPYPLLGLADARSKAKAALAVVVSGGDPAAAKRADRDAPTFAELVEVYLERHAKPRKRSWRDDERMLRRYVPKEWYRVRASDVTRRDIRDLLDSMVARTPILANRILALLRKLYNFGVAREIVTASPCLGVDRPAPERQRDRVLTEDEIRRVWRALDGEDRATSALMKLYLLTAQRGGELRSMAWANIDLGGGWWVIPAERSKNGLAHRVPLSPQVVAILQDLQAHVGASSTWVFATPSASGYRETVQIATRRIRRRSGLEFVPHDLRRTAASHMTSLGVSRLTVAKILNHVESGVTAVYDRHSYDAEKRAALKAWATRLDAIVRYTTGPGMIDTTAGATQPPPGFTLAPPALPVAFRARVIH